MALSVGILMFDEVEVLDFAGPLEVFSVTRVNHPESFNRVILIADTPTIRTNGGMQVVVDHVIENNKYPSLDILLIPGGQGTVVLSENQRVLDWVIGIRPSLKYVISVCTGAKIMGKCKIVDGLVITTHNMCFKEVGADCLNSIMCTCRRFIDNEPIYTSAGVSAGIDLAIYFVKKHFGLEVAASTAKVMEYNWTDPDVRPCTCVCGAEEKAAIEFSCKK